MSWQEVEKLPGFINGIRRKRDKHMRRSIRYLSYQIDSCLSNSIYFGLITKLKNPRK